MLSNEKDLFTKVKTKLDKIKHPKLKKFNIINEAKFIKCVGRDSLEMPFSTEENVIYGDLDINILFVRYRFPYCIVALSGDGLFALRGAINKYVNEEVLPYIKEHINNKYKIPIDFKTIEYENNHFSSKYWGNNITTKYGYNSNNKMYIRISCNDLNDLLKKNPKLNEYYLTGTIKSIKGKNPDLDYILEDRKKLTGYFKFKRDGAIKCDFFDVRFFNDFLNKLIDKGFYGRK